MNAYRGSPPRTRAAAAAVSAVLVGSIGAALVLGLAGRLPPQAQVLRALVAVNLDPPPPPQPPPEPATGGSSAKGVPAPRGLRNKATPVVAAPSPVILQPPPIAAATAPASGSAAQSGASDLAGPGPGAGGIGDGTGGGGTGGTGSGTGFETGPRQIRGKFSIRDFPDGLIGPGEQSSVGVRYAVETDGRASNCRIDRSSGFAEVDAMACRLIVQRFRFRPARDAAGRPVRSTVIETHTWYNRP